MPECIHSRYAWIRWPLHRAGTARQEVRDLLKEAGKKAEEAGQTILFSGAENYLPVLDDLFKDLTTKRIALAMNSPEWKEKLHMVFLEGG